mgnify:CR=1 FL=1
MEFAQTWQGIFYNAPALCLLAGIWIRRPFLALFLTGLTALRVEGGSVPFSMHACVAGAAVTALSGWERGAGVGLAFFTAWWYLGAWAAPEPFHWGLSVGLICGGPSGLYWALRRTKC